MNSRAPVAFQHARPKGVARPNESELDLSKPTPPPAVPTKPKSSRKAQQVAEDLGAAPEPAEEPKPRAAPRKRRRSVLDIVDAVTILLADVPKRQRGQIMDIVKRTLA